LARVVKRVATMAASRQRSAPELERPAAALLDIDRCVERSSVLERFRPSCARMHHRGEILA
jgi:hypothetical protein